MAIVLTYLGYTLYDRPTGGYRCNIDGADVTFDTVSQWYQYIKLIRNKA